MGTIVSAGATSHILFNPAPAPEAARRIVAGMEESGRRMAAARPDVLLIISSDHMFNINLRVQPPFCIGVSDRFLPFGDMGIPRTPFPGHREFALSLARFSAQQGFDLALAEGLKPDHGVTLPLLFIKPWGSVPTVPLYVNINMDPVPSVARCLALAECMRRWIATERPPQERVAVLASGGLSHWLNIPGAGTVAEEFDREFIDRLARGDHARYTTMSTDDIRRSAGNGGLEIMNWMMMAAMVPGTGGEKLYYEPMPAWQTGMGGLAMRL